MKVKKAKLLFLVLVFFFSATITKAQTKLQVDLNWLNQNTATTHRYGLLTYDITFVFEDKGISFYFSDGWKIIYWNQISALSVTTTNRLYMSYTNAVGTQTFQYITPSDSVSASLVMYRLLSVLEDQGYNRINGTRVTIGDADEDYAKQKEQRNNEQSPNDVYAQALSDFVDDVFTRYTMYGFAYTGLDYKPSGYNDKHYQKFSFQITGVRKYGNIIAEISYAKSPDFVVGAYRNGLITRKDTVNRTGGMFNFGAGPNFRLFKNSMQVYADVMSSGFFYKKNYSEEDGIDWFVNLTAGATFRLGTVGLGLVYEYGIRMTKEKVNETIAVDPSSYKTTAVVANAYGNWSSIGVRLTFNFKKGTSR